MYLCTYLTTIPPFPLPPHNATRHHEPTSYLLPLNSFPFLRTYQPNIPFKSTHLPTPSPFPFAPTQPRPHLPRSCHVLLAPDHPFPLPSSYLYRFHIEATMPSWLKTSWPSRLQADILLTPPQILISNTHLPYVTTQSTP